MLGLKKEIREKHQWLIHKDENLGIMVFMSNSQRQIQMDCDIIVADSTFSSAPQSFLQVFFMHGLVIYLLSNYEYCLFSSLKMQTVPNGCL